MFRFTIRELLLLTLVVALGVGWGIREFQLGPALKEANKSSRRWHTLQRRWKQIEDENSQLKGLKDRVASLNEENDGLRLEIKLLKRQLLGDE